MADRSGSVLKRAAASLTSLQRDDGSWEGEVVWCTMILSQYVIVRTVVGRPIGDEDRRRMIQHYSLTRTPEGGWPLHPEGPPQVFTTTLAYIALRLLGVPSSDPQTVAARSWLHAQEHGVLAIPTWGKFWLSLLDLYGADGVAALPPELFLLPLRFAGHPFRWYCHTRHIYLGMSYLSGRGFRAALGPLRDELRHELYQQAYEDIDFRVYRDWVSAGDRYARPTVALNAMRTLMPAVAKSIPSGVRQRALAFCLDRILYEQRVSRHQALSPVNGLLNCLAIFAADPNHPDFEPSLAGLEAWRWVDSDAGIRYAGARSQVWDTAFATRALLATLPDVEGSTREGLRLAHRYLTQTQMTAELPDRELEHREAILGGWCFSDGMHRWPVSDCAAEALTAILEVERVPGLIRDGDRLAPGRIEAALRFLLARQNGDGGFSTYEAARAGTWLDRLNPSEMFRDCMTERSYVECTASVLEALATVKRVRPELMPARVVASIDRALAFLRRAQREDGTFPAAWGIHYTYSMFHVMKALCAAGMNPRDPTLTRAADWLRRVQRADGGWGEHFRGSLEDRYVEHPRSQAVMTSWAVLALAEIDPGCAAVRSGAAWLASAQRPDGSWAHGAVNGVFFGTAMLEYALYAAYFPVWALARADGASRPWPVSGTVARDNGRCP